MSGVESSSHQSFLKILASGKSPLEMTDCWENPPELIFLALPTRCSKNDRSCLTTYHHDTSGFPKALVFGISMKVQDQKFTLGWIPQILDVNFKPDRLASQKSYCKSWKNATKMAFLSC
jgi:hypothetical protein